MRNPPPGPIANPILWKTYQSFVAGAGTRRPIPVSPRDRPGEFRFPSFPAVGHGSAVARILHANAKEKQVSRRTAGRFELPQRGTVAGTCRYGLSARADRGRPNASSIGPGRTPPQYRERTLHPYVLRRGGSAVCSAPLSQPAPPCPEAQDPRPGRMGGRQAGLPARRHISRRVLQGCDRGTARTRLDTPGSALPPACADQAETRDPKRFHTPCTAGAPIT